MATIRPSTSVQCTYLEPFLPVWLSIETYYSSVRISVLFGKWHCFQTLLRCLWWVYFEGLSFLSTLLYPLHSGCVGRIYVISRTLFQVFWIWFVQLYDFSVYTNVVHLPPNPAPSFLLWCVLLQLLLPCPSFVRTGLLFRRLCVNAGVRNGCFVVVC